MNGSDLGGRPLLVREDREDRDVKQAEGGVQAPRAPRAPRGGRAGRGPAERTGESSGLQIVVQGIPWAYTWKELKEMFTEIGDIERADVTIGSDGRSRGFGTVKFTNADAAQRAIALWHEQDLDGRRVAVFLDKFA
mmetsp:Transcript_23335/g.69320  ORF Transcript_23335/g.69320 Transcript_23335/m.69320 type:complete len:136 (+) Transcript_23335:458-865(+)